MDQLLGGQRPGGIKMAGTSSTGVGEDRSLPLVRFKEIVDMAPLLTVCDLGMPQPPVSVSLWVKVG